MRSSLILEACVESLEEAVRAERFGADRLELCSDLERDGLTPSIELVMSILDQVRIPVKVMLRSRAGDFEYDRNDLHTMLLQLKQLKTLPVSGVVYGAVKGTTLDYDSIAQIAAMAGIIPVTVHKAIDTVDDPVGCVARLVQIKNVKAILTSGGAETALSGRNVINAMHDATKGKIKVIAAGKITSENLEVVQQALNVQEYHGRRIVGSL